MAQQLEYLRIKSLLPQKSGKLTDLLHAVTAKTDVVKGPIYPEDRPPLPPKTTISDKKNKKISITKYDYPRGYKKSNKDAEVPLRNKPPNPQTAGDDRRHAGLFEAIPSTSIGTEPLNTVATPVGGTAPDALPGMQTVPSVT